MALRLARLADFATRTRDARKVLVVDLGFLGDTLHTVPALWELRRYYPHAGLHMLAAPVGAEVLALAPCVDRAWAFPLSQPSPPPWKHWGILRALRRERFEVALNFSGADRPLFINALTRAPWRVAHDAGRPHAWRRWLIPNWIPRQSRGLPIFEQRRQVLAQLGFPLGPARFDLALPPAARDWAEANVPAGALHVSINASSPVKEWPLAHWAALARQLLRDQPGRCLVATGSPSPREQARLGEFADAVDDPRLRVFRAPLAIAQLAALLARCACHLGADSGVLHLAVAVGIPTFSIFRDYEGLPEWCPSGPVHAAIVEPCPCEAARVWTAACHRQAQCLTRVAPEVVAIRLREHLRSAGTGL